MISEESTIERSFVKSDNVGVRSMQLDVYPIRILTHYEATAIASVLEECVDHLAILRYAIPAEIDDRWDDIVKPIKEKYGASEEPRIIIREETNLPPLMLSKAAKLQRDRFASEFFIDVHIYGKKKKRQTKKLLFNIHTERNYSIKIISYLLSVQTLKIFHYFHSDY